MGRVPLRVAQGQPYDVTDATATHLARNRSESVSSRAGRAGEQKVKVEKWRKLSVGLVRILECHTYQTARIRNTTNTAATTSPTNATFTNLAQTITTF